MKIFFHNTPPLSGVRRVEDKISHLVARDITYPDELVFPMLAFKIVDQAGQPCQDETI